MKHSTDICIVGAGPVGLFAVFEAGLLKMRCHLIDALPAVGGQLSEIYPKKPIYDIPGFPEILAQDLVDNLLQQIEPFKPTYSLGERAERFERKADNSFVVHGSEGSQIECKVIVIAGGLGSFEPRKPEIADLERFEKGKGIEYMVRNPEQFRDKKIVIAGGGDSALDWTIFLAQVAQSVTLVHRNESFRGAPDSAEKVKHLADEGKIQLLLKSQVVALQGEQRLSSLTIKNSKQEYNVEADYFIPLFGLTPKLGVLAEWGLEVENNALKVNTVDYSTNIEGIYAIGDINTYQGKLKLILCGFHEAALMAQSAFKLVFPDKKFSLKYTTVNGVQAF